MGQLNLKKLLVLGAFAITGIVALYLFALLSGEEKPAGEGGQVQIIQAPEEAQQAVQQAQAVDEAQFYPPDEILASICSQYSNLPADVVPCRDAYDFVIKAYK